MNDDNRGNGLLGYIPLKDLPNRKECPIPGCGCTPNMKKQGFHDPFYGLSKNVVFVKVPFCKSGKSLATLEEATYAGLLACRRFLLQESAITGKSAKIVRRCLGFSLEELEMLVEIDRGRIREIENHDIESHGVGGYLFGNSWHMLLLGLVCKQIHKYES